MKTATRTLTEMLREYDADRSNDEIRRFRNMPSLAAAIKTAAESRKENGKPYEHQRKNWNFWPEAIPKATAILVKAEDQFRGCADFDDIHDLIKRFLSRVEGLKDLYCYDVAVRIGAFLDKLPERVYLHAGTLEGAKLLNLPTKQGVLEMPDLPLALRTKRPWEVEDILCYYAKCRRHDRRQQQRQYGGRPD